MARRGRRQVAIDPTQLPVVGMAEAAALTGMDPRTLAKCHTRGQLPAPLAQLACGPIWETRVILEYARRRNGDQVAAGAMAAELAPRLLVDDTGTPVRAWPGGPPLAIVAEHVVPGAEPEAPAGQGEWVRPPRPDEVNDEGLLAIDQVLVQADQVVQRVGRILEPEVGKKKGKRM